MGAVGNVVSDRVETAHNCGDETGLFPGMSFAISDTAAPQTVDAPSNKAHPAIEIFLIKIN